jgi:hypothetical protein
MALSDRAAVLAPYLQRLLYDEGMQDAVRRVVAATQDAYRRASGKSARQAVEDKKLRHRLQQSVRAVVELGCVIAEPSQRRNRRWGRGLVVLTVAAAGVLVAANTEARERILGLLGKNDAKTREPAQ